MIRRQLQGRLNADDNGIGVSLPKGGNGRGGCRIAGNDDRLYPPLQHRAKCRKGQRPHRLPGAGAIGRVSRITVVPETFPRHLPDQVPQNADPPHSGIKHRNGITFVAHGLT